MDFSLRETTIWTLKQHGQQYVTEWVILHLFLLTLINDSYNSMQNHFLFTETNSRIVKIVPDTGQKKLVKNLRTFDFLAYNSFNIFCRVSSLLYVQL